MPLPPFHLGPGLAAKAVAGRHFSFMVFGFSQVLIDLEPLYYLLRDDPPLHRFLHTYLGASLLLAVVLVPGKSVCDYCLRLWREVWSFLLRKDDPPPTKITWLAASAGGIFGVYSHVLLDSIMHDDIRPLAPFSQANPLFQAISMGELHVGCAALGVLGAMALFVIWVWNLWTYEV